MRSTCWEDCPFTPPAGLQRSARPRESGDPDNAQRMAQILASAGMSGGWTLYHALSGAIASGFKITLTASRPVLDCARHRSLEVLRGGKRSGGSSRGSKQDRDPRISNAGYPGGRRVDEDGGRRNL